MEFLITIIIIGLILIGLVGVGVIIFTSMRSETEPPLPYQLKKYFFSRSEQEFLRILNQTIDRERYLIFPKVRLADFIEVTVRGQEYQGWLNKIKSKHVDFLIWDIEQNRIALAIELDGRSHNTEKMQERDEFVNKLYEQVGVKLERVRVGSNFIAEIDNLSSMLNV